MGFWDVIVPEGQDITNLITNPSFETGSTGWNTYGGSTIAQATLAPRRGSHTLYIAPVSSASGCSFDVPMTSGLVYTFSVDVSGAVGRGYQLIIANNAWTTKGSTSFTGNGRWQRHSVTITADATHAAWHVAVIKTGADTDPFLIDGAQVVQLDHDTLYIDGDQEDCYWTSLEHGSTSVRPATSRAGGQTINLDTLGLYLSGFPGTGLPPLAAEYQDLPLQDGALYRGTSVRKRVFSLIGEVNGSSWANLHSKRKALIDILKPDLAPADAPVIFRYSGSNSNRPLFIRGVLEDGLSFGQPDGFSEAIGLRFTAPDPYLYEEGNDGAALTGLQSVTVNYIVKRVNDAWSALGTGMNGDVWTLCFGGRGRLYAGGNFTTAGGTTVNYIAKWDGSAWSALGATGVNAAVRCIILAPDGSFRVGGDFTTAAGTTVNHVAKWSGTSWSALGGTPGVNGIVTALCFDHAGNLYAAGSFSSAGGSAAANIAMWDGSNWNALGSGLNGTANALAVAPNGDIYVGGSFTTAGGTTVNYIARWNGTTWSALGSGMNVAVGNGVFALAFGPDGTLYIGGKFTTAGGVTVNNICKWNGASYEALGTGVNDAVQCLVFTPDGLLYAGGDFLAASGLDLLTSAAVWNGSTWAHLSIKLFAGTSVYAIGVWNNDVYLGCDVSGTAQSSAVDTITNSGTAHAYPKFRIKRSGGSLARVLYLKNLTNNTTLWLNYSLLNGETLTIDLTPGMKTATSDFFGNVIGRAILRNSDVGQFRLEPGSNSIVSFIYTAGSPTMEQFISWNTRHWSLDGSAA